MTKTDRKFNKALSGLYLQAEQMAHYDDNYQEYDPDSGNFAPSRQMSRRQPLVVVESHQNPGRKPDRAQFDLVIIRDTNTIAQPLPIALFGPSHLQSGYSQFLSLGAGTSVVVTGGLNSATPDRIRFAFANGANADNVDVLCNQVPYPDFLAALAADKFKISNIRYRLTNSADQIQFSQAHSFRTKTLFGKGSDNDVNVGAYLKPEQFQPGVIDIPIAANTDKETMFLANIADTATAYPFSFTLSVFVEKFDLHNGPIK